MNDMTKNFRRITYIAVRPSADSLSTYQATVHRAPAKYAQALCDLFNRDGYMLEDRPGAAWYVGETLQPHGYAVDWVGMMCEIQRLTVRKNGDVVRKYEPAP